MKKFKYILLFCLVLTGFIVRSQTIQMRIPALGSTVGNTIDVPVYVDNSLTGFNVLSFQLKITYNSNYLSYNSTVIAGTMVSGWGSPTVNSSTRGHIEHCSCRNNTPGWDRNTYFISVFNALHQVQLPFRLAEELLPISLMKGCRL